MEMCTPSFLIAARRSAVAAASRMRAVSVISIVSAPASRPLRVECHLDVGDDRLPVELATGDVDRHGQVVTLTTPLRRLLARLGQDPSADVDDLAVVLEQRDEPIG